MLLECTMKGKLLSFRGRLQEDVESLHELYDECDDPALCIEIMEVIQILIDADNRINGYRLMNLKKI